MLISALLSLFGVVSCGGVGAGDQARIPDPLAGVPARDLFERGRALVVRGDSIRAEQYLTAAMDRGYPEREAMPLLIRACVSSSRLSSALGYAEPYLRRHPGDWSLRFLVATLQQGLGRTERARVNLEQVVVDAPEAPEPEFVLAMLLRDDLSLEDEARPLLERYLELAPRGRHAAEVRAALAPSRVRLERAPVEIRRDDPPDGDTPSESPIPSIAHDAESGVQP